MRETNEPDEQYGWSLSTFDETHGMFVAEHADISFATGIAHRHSDGHRNGIRIVACDCTDDRDIRYYISKPLPTKEFALATLAFLEVHCDGIASLKALGFREES